MRRPAKILSAGAPAAAIMMLFAGAATSQSLLDNTQTQTGVIISDQTLDVVTATDSTTASTTAVGNTVLGSVQTGDFAVTSAQALTSPVSAHTLLNVSGSPGAVTSLNTSASGNSGDVAIAGGGAMSGGADQTAGSVGISSVHQIEGATASAGNVSATTLATANTLGVAATNGSSTLTSSQSSGADVLADGGAIVRYVSGTSTISGVAAGNNVSLIGVSGSSQAFASTQTNTGPRVQASQFTAYGNANLTATTATASGNNLNASNTGELLDVTNTQTNLAYVRGQAEETSYEFGSAVASATGVGNSVLAGDFGSEVHLDNTQVNSGGGVDVVSSFSGDNGYDASSNAVAMGNAATSYACSACSAKITGVNRQTNDVDISATSTLTFTTSARSVNGTATAVGNSASYYVSAPHP